MRTLLIVGANDFAPFLHATDVAIKSHEKGLMTIVDQSFISDEKGRGWVADNRDHIDAVMGHYGLACVHPSLAIGPLAGASRRINTDSKRFARSFVLPWVSGSGGKLPGQIVAYSTLDYVIGDNCNEVSLMSNLRNAVRNGRVENHEGHASYLDIIRLGLAQRRGNKARALGDSSV